MPIRRPRVQLSTDGMDENIARALTTLQQNSDQLVSDISALRDGRLYGHVNAGTLPVLAGARGDFVKFNAPTVNVDGSILLGWICTVAGDAATAVWEEVRACDCAAAGGGSSSATKPSDGTGTDGDYVQNENPEITYNSDGTITITIGWVKIDGAWVDVKSFVSFDSNAAAVVYPLPLYAAGSSAAVLGSPYGSTYVYEFTQGVDRDVHTSFRVPQYYNAAFLQIAVTTPNVEEGDVKWQLGVLVQAEGSFYGNNQENVVTLGTIPNDQVDGFPMTYLSDYSIPDLTEGVTVNLRIIRAGGAAEDTLTESAYLMHASLRIEKTV
jgi:hypothetical protein